MFNGHNRLGLLLVFVFAFASGPANAAEYPTSGLLPKEETGALRFLAEHAEYDGRGVIVAVFDTGVDPSVEGLQTTPDGRPKIVDMVDGSGSGDVDTSKVQEPKDGVLSGLTGRSLKIPTAWKNPTGKYRIGIKRAYELFPRDLVSRLKRKRKEKWDAAQRKTVADAEQALADWKKEHAQPKRAEKKERDELQARIDLLQKLQKSYDDPGPVFDCVVFHDGNLWRAVVDTDQDGDLADEKVLTNFRRERQFASFGEEVLLHFALNIYDEGDVLSIVTDCGAHGTHVAGIIGAYFPEQPELNGLAPGVQIVSVKIGDSRLGSSSTGAGEVRGLIAVLENKCDLINMSYGGPTADPNSGRVTGLYSEIVNKHGVIFVASAGNSGPALSTVGAPGGCTSALLGVGAYVSPAMMKAEYSLRQELPEIPYTWTSRGPTFDGDLGVDICAPGGAISPVPQWTLQRNMLMNGTSMSSPNACGNIALLLSGLKKQEVGYTPHSVRRALQNTARPLEASEVFAHGRGLIQTDKAFDYLIENANANGEELRFEISLPKRNNDRGIYIREPYEQATALTTTVKVNPVFHHDASPALKVGFEMNVILEATKPWVDAPESVHLIHGGRTFEVKVDPTELKAGVHYAEVIGFEEGHRERGPLFRLPITVVRPVRLESEGIAGATTFTFKPGEIHRTFIDVPQGATWADLLIRGSNIDGPRRFILHTLQHMPRQSFDNIEVRKFFSIAPRQERVETFEVEGGRTLELCLAQYWSSLGDSEIEILLTFHAIRPNNESTFLDGADLMTRLDVTAPLRDEHFAPKAQLKTLRRSVRPSKHLITPLKGARDLLPESRRIHQLILTYEFTLSAAAKATPRFPLSQQDEFWNSFESNIWMMFDSAKRLLGSGGGDSSVSLGKGKHTLLLNIRHDDPQTLEKLKDMPMLLDLALSSPLSVGVHADPDDVLGGRSFSAREIHRGGRVSFFLAPPKKFGSAAKPGDLLLGSISFGKTDHNLAGGGQRPDGFSITCLVPPAANSADDKDDDSGAKKKELSADEKLANALRDAKLAFLKTLRGKKTKDDYDKLAAELVREYPQHLPLYVELLERLDNDDRKQHLPAVVAAANKVIKHIKAGKLAAHYGVNLDQDDPQAVQQRKEFDKQKNILTDALYRKARAIAYMDLPQDKDKTDIPKQPKKREKRDKLFEKTVRKLKKWVDITDSKYALLYVRRERRQGRPAKGLLELQKLVKESPTKKLLYKKRIDIYQELGWEHWRAYEAQWKIIRFPEKYPLF